MCLRCSVHKLSFKCKVMPIVGDASLRIKAQTVHLPTNITCTLDLSFNDVYRSDWVLLEKCLYVCKIEEKDCLKGCF